MVLRSLRSQCTPVCFPYAVYASATDVTHVCGLPKAWLHINLLTDLLPYLLTYFLTDAVILLFFSSNFKHGTVQPRRTRSVTTTRSDCRPGACRIIGSVPSAGWYAAIVVVAEQFSGRYAAALKTNAYMVVRFRAPHLCTPHITRGPGRSRVRIRNA